MFVNSISNTPNVQYGTAFRAKVNQREMMKMFLSQDMCNTRLTVRRPETPEEKNVLLEILRMRLKLDKFYRYTNERGKILSQLDIGAALADTAPDSEEYAAIRKSLLARGNIVSVVSTLNKKIKQEELRNKDAIKYFDDINKTEQVYYGEIPAEGEDKPKKLLSPEKARKFWDQVRKHNINPDGALSTQELIDIIERDEKPLTRDEVKAQIAEQYKNTLLQIINIYSDHTSHYMDAVRARNEVIQRHEAALAQFPGIDKDLAKIYEATEQSIIKKVNRLVDVRRKVDGKWVTGIDIHPVGEYIKIMDKKVQEIKDAQQEIEKIRLKFQETPDDPSLKEELKKQLMIITEAKEYWLGVLEFSVEKEYANREIFDSVGRLSEYEELTNQNRTLLRHRELLDIAKKNGDSLPEEVWDEILK